MPRRFLLLLAAFTALALTSLAGIATAASTNSGAQNRVWALQTPDDSLIGLTALESSCSRPGSVAGSVEIMAGFCVAAEEGGATVFRTARLGRGASELENGLNPADFSAGDQSAYVGDEAAARTLSNPLVGGYENFATRFEMASPFESEFAPFKFPYPEGGPESFEYQIPQNMIGRFNELTISRTGVPYAP